MLKSLRVSVWIGILALASLSVQATPAATSAPTYGVDANYDGVWDDTESALEQIASRASDSYRAFHQMAAAMRAMIEYGPYQSDPEFLDTCASAVRAFECVFYHHPFDDALVSAAWNAVLSTPERNAAWDSATARAAQLGAPGPSQHATEWYRSCEFPVTPKPDWPPLESLMQRNLGPPSLDPSLFPGRQP